MRNKRTIDEDTGIMLGCVFPFFAMLFTAFFGYISHLFWVFDVMMSNDPVTMGEFFLSVVGTLMFPIGCVHGIYLWFM